MTENGNPDEDINCQMEGLDKSTFAPGSQLDASGKQSRRTTKKRHGARNQHRHKHFCKWLLQTFPHLQETNHDQQHTDAPGINIIRSHILDVAGGKGELAARLSICHRLDVVMVDPREANVAQCFETLVLPKLPNKWQRRFQEQTRANPNFCQNVVTQRFRQLVTNFDEHNLNHSTELQEAVENSSLLIGMHADGATEAILDAAILYSKPCVVVPCCVFPNLFTERRVKENGVLVPVRSHEQFCRYLSEKDSRLVVETLPFEGRNTAIWYNPHTTDAQA